MPMQFRAEKIKVWKAVQPIHPADNTVRGQYGPGIVDGKPVVGYRQEERVHPRSQTETYAALRLEIENWRWAGVPFYIRAGKRLAKRVTEISIQFKLPPLLLFKDAHGKGGEGIGRTCSPCGSSLMRELRYSLVPKSPGRP